MDALPNYMEVEDVLYRIKAPTNASEAHGLVCGFICAGQAARGKDWIEPVLGHIANNNAVAKQSLQYFVDLYSFSFQQIASMDFCFTLLIPDDDYPISDRARGLGDWCQGFMAGLGLAGFQISDSEAEETRDALYHVSEIAKIDYELLEPEDTDERSFTEVFEYIRMAVLSLYVETSGGKKDVTMTEQGYHTIH